MEALGLLLNGIGIALRPENVIFAFIGCMLGSALGVLPGIGPTAGAAISLPVVFAVDPLPGIIMLAAIYYGAQYGGSITSILLNVPGDASSAATCIEGYPMAKRGRGGAALSITAIGSFIGGLMAAVVLVVAAVPLAKAALQLGPPELFAVMVAGMSMVVALTGRSIALSLFSAFFGLLVATWGIDPGSGIPRFTFGEDRLLDGVGLIPMIVGMFGIGEILKNGERPFRQVITSRISELWVTKQEAKDSVWPILRGSVIGILIGILPGVGAVTSTFLSYVAEKKLSKTPEKFGTDYGMIEGVAAPEASNNACVNAALIPMFTLGIPGSSGVAVIMGAFMMKGIIPGPFLFQEQPELVWGIIGSLYVGNFMLLVTNLPMIPLWTALLRLPYSILFSVILIFTIVGTYTIKNSFFDVGLTFAFGWVGYFFRKLDIPLGPLALTFILGPLTEKGMRRSLQISGGDFSIFWTRPLTLFFLLLAVAVVAGFTWGQVRKKDEEVEPELSAIRG